MWNPAKFKKWKVYLNLDCPWKSTPFDEIIQAAISGSLPFAWKTLPGQIPPLTIAGGDMFGLWIPGGGRSDFLLQGEAGPWGVPKFGIQNVEFGILCFHAQHSAFPLPPVPRSEIGIRFICIMPFPPSRATPEMQSIVSLRNKKWRASPPPLAPPHFR